MRSLLSLVAAICLVSVSLQAQKPRERDLNLPIGGTPGALDAITDVAGVVFVEDEERWGGGGGGVWEAGGGGGGAPPGGGAARAGQGGGRRRIT